MEFINDKHLQTSESERQPSQEINLQQLSKIVFTNFIYDISVFLTKKEKMMLRQINMGICHETFSEFQINLIFRKKNELEEFNSENMDLKKITDHYKNTEELTIENITLNENTLSALDTIIENNSTRIRSLTLNNIDYGSNENCGQLINIFNKLKSLTEFSIGNIGNRDKLIIHLIKHNKAFLWADQIKVLKIDNIMLNQICDILILFLNISDLTIQNCSLDEDLQLIAKCIIDKFKENFLVHLDLSYNGLSSIAARDSLKQILRHNQLIQRLSLKGLWFQSVGQLEEELKSMKNLTFLEMIGSKNIFDDVNSFVLFTGTNHLKVLNLGDSRLDDEDLNRMLGYLHPANASSLEELNIFRSFVTNSAIDILIKYKDKLNSLQILNLSFNQKLGAKGLNMLCENILLFPNLKQIFMRNCGIILKHSFGHLIDLIFHKPRQLEIFELYFSSFNASEYLSFIEQVYKASNNLTSEIDIRLKIWLKINFATNKDLFKKSENLREFLYKRHNLMIR